MRSSVTTIRPVRKQSAEVQAADALRTGIMSGEIPPGTRLTEIRLAEQLEISRATVRTALHQLSQEGVIVQIPYTGWAVMTLSSRDAWELYTLRSSLEALAARLTTDRLAVGGVSAANIRERVIAAFDGLVDACRGGNRLDIAEADFRLHKTIVDLADHRRLAEQYRRVEQQVRIYIASSDALVQDPGIIVGQHRPIVEAILSGDAGRAAELSVAHNDEQGQILVGYLRTLEDRLPA